MTKRRGQRQRSESKVEQQSNTSTAFRWIPLWGWALIFLLPLLISEFMFWNVGRTFSMILFPVAWVGFWYVMMQRSGWAILKQRKGKEEPTSEENG
ncbi:MAG: hypothetical protein PVI07_06025 [Anaerolineae bacterium]|jgi:hypothetical protein